MNISFRLAARDMRKHLGRTIVAIILFALPLALLGGIASVRDTSEKTTHDLAASGQTLPLMVNVSVMGDDACDHVIDKVTRDTAFCTNPARATLTATDWPTRVHDVVGDDFPVWWTGRQPAKLHMNGTVFFDSVTVVDPQAPLAPPEGTIALPATATGLMAPAGTAVDVEFSDTYGKEHVAHLTVSTMNAPHAPAVINGADVPWLTLEPPTPTGQSESTFGSELVAASMPNISDQVLAEAGLDFFEPFGWDGAKPALLTSILKNSAPGTEGLTTIFMMIALAILLVVSIAAPIFAVAARRQRRVMGLLVSAGATDRQLHGVLLWQGLVTGFVGAILGTIASIPAGHALIGLIRLLTSHDDHYSLGGLGLSFSWAWDLLLLLIPVAIAAGLLAALLPARAAATQDAIHALRGGTVQAMPTLKKLDFLGPIMVIVGLVLSCITTSSFAVVTLIFPFIALGTVLSGTMLVWILAAKIGRVLPLPGRLAARDALRNLGRTGPAVAATAALSFCATVVMVISLLPVSPDFIGSTGRNVEPKTMQIVNTFNTVGPTPAQTRTINKLAGFIHPVTTADIYDAADWPDRSAGWWLHRDGDSDDPDLSGPVRETLDGLGIHDPDHLWIIASSGLGTALGFTEASATALDEVLARGKAAVINPDHVIKVSDDQTITLDRIRYDKDPERPREVKANVLDAVDIPAESLDAHYATTTDHTDRAFVVIPPEALTSRGITLTWQKTVLTADKRISALQTLRAQFVTRKSNGIYTRASGPALVSTLLAVSPVVAGWLVAFGAVLLVLLLAAAESRKDIAIMGAVGASPKLVGRFMGAQGALIALAGTIPGVIIALLATPRIFLIEGVDKTLIVKLFTSMGIVGISALIVPVLAYVAGRLIARSIKPDTAALRRD